MNRPRAITAATRAWISSVSGPIWASGSNKGIRMRRFTLSTRLSLPSAAVGLLQLASVTDSLVTLATHIIRDLGLFGVALLTLTSATIGVPGTEPTMLFAGFNVFQKSLSLFGIIVFGVIGD